MQVPPLPRSPGGFLDAVVENHTEERRLLDDLTVLVALKLPPLPIVAVAEEAVVGV